ncbi:hypothetical protein BOTBODRAFT_48966 [Botryobasidium botryosum FD-172 SS1]|uniref:Prenylcysteine lyase domain-containing protein n=1 Tax=Botryobasidium botryosum (strain FD-172 SS1) TaxID=930990 RepID=A0A067M6B2_BOTB1|nr:hypothetical protein BOTBODRAFT_48966 [Botryobasidium botryosum FD-172 SS1]
MRLAFLFVFLVSTLSVYYYGAYLATPAPLGTTWGSYASHRRASSLITRQHLRIAIVGAGTAGTSAAFWIETARRRLNLTGPNHIEVHVFEKEDHIGGTPDRRANLPVMASVFTDRDYNLARACNLFGINTTMARVDGNDTGIWDGHHFLHRWSAPEIKIERLWVAMKFFWHYGATAALDFHDLAQGVNAKLLKLYEPSGFVWDNSSEIAAALDMSLLLEESFATHLALAGIGRRYTSEVLESRARELHGVNLDQIHALGGIRSIGTTSRRYVEGGAGVISSQFLAHSNATLHLRSQVTRLHRVVHSGGETTWSVQTADRKALIEGRSSSASKYIKTHSGFHHVILAATQSHAKTRIDVPNANFSDAVYTHLHVTLLSTTAPHPDPSYFSLPEYSKVPNTILTSSGKQTSPEFYSLSYGAPVAGLENGTRTWAVQILSEDRKEDSWLEKVFGAGKVGWIRRSEWYAPRLMPGATHLRAQLEPGLWYADHLEQFISSQEMQTIASRNIVQRIFQQKFQRDICGRHSAPGHNATFQGVDGQGHKPTRLGTVAKIWGWDC